MDTVSYVYGVKISDDYKTAERLFSIKTDAFDMAVNSSFFVLTRSTE